jgi:ribosome-binding factor A
MGKSDRTRAPRERAETRVHSIRHERLESLIREEINSIFESEMQNPVFDGIRITRVELTRDGSRARLWYAVDPSHAREPKDAALARASGFLRTRLNDALDLKRVPELRFCSDPTAYSEPLLEH